MIKFYLSFLFTLLCQFTQAQNILTYAGGSGNETFTDVTQLSNGTFLVSGFCTNAAWLPTSVPNYTLNNYSTNNPATEIISNGLGTNKIPFIIQLSSNMGSILSYIKLNPNSAESIDHLKFSNLPYSPTGDIYISGTTKDSKANGGGYFIAKLNNNFINGLPDDFVWIKNVWAEGETQINQPWDVTSDGKVVFVLGQSHANDWCQIARLNDNGVEGVVTNWRTHWDNMGAEYKGLKANYMGGNPLIRSGIVLKWAGRCDLRSWTNTDFNTWSADGNGGMKKGKWPMDFLFNSPCNTLSVSTAGPGYNGYKRTSTQTYAGLAVAVDKRDNSFYIGMNTKTTINSSSQPDFEPAVFKMDSTGSLIWWSRLYHEVNPNGDTVLSTPDQYVDGLYMDYANNNIVVNARCHGNNTTNLWPGINMINNPTVTGFQKQFTGTQGNIHISWLGKLANSNGDLKAATFVAEYNNTTTGLGQSLTDPNLDNWPNPNDGWPNVNTTRIARGSLNVATDGSVYFCAVGRRTITTVDAHQKMVKQLASNNNSSAWNNYVRGYSPNLDSIRYSSLVTGAWDTIAGTNGDNTTLFAVHKTTDGIVAVGHKKIGGNEVPLLNVPSWGSSTTQDSTALLAYYKSPKLVNANDLLFDFSGAPLSTALEFSGYKLSNANELIWRMQGNDNLKEIVLQHSTNGNNFYDLKNYVDLDKTNFNFAHQNFGFGNNYYRLKLITKNGSFEYSNIVALYNSKKFKIEVVPNPAQNTLHISSITNFEKYFITDQSGKIIKLGNFTNDIDIKELPIGIYLLNLNTKQQLSSLIFEKN